MDQQQQPTQPGQARDPYADNPLFQAGYQHAQKAAVDATMRGQDPYQAAYQAAHQGIRQAAQPDPSQPGGGNLQKVQQWLVQNKGVDPDQALALAHQILPRLNAGGGGGGQ